ncbi:MAG: hypothetical protein ABIQ88_20255 [Chitinophagaceae bacterium]
MPFPKRLLLFLFCAGIQFSLLAQRAKYTDIDVGFNPKIAGNIHNRIHVWSASAEHPFPGKGDITLTLHIYSLELQPETEKKIPLGKIKYWGMDFQFTDSCYYANLVYFSDTRKNLLLKIDAAGNITDVSSTPRLWIRARPFEERNRNYTVLRKKSSLFAVKVQQSNTRDSFETTTTVPQPGEHIIINKIDTLETIEQSYSSANTNFHNPLLAVTDTSIIVAAIADRELTKKNNSNSTRLSSLLFLVRLDSNLAETGGPPNLLKLSAGNKDEVYIPFRIFLLGDNVLLTSRGLYNRGLVNYYSERSTGLNNRPQRVIYNSFFTNSMKFLLLDRKNNVLKDTLIENKFSNGSTQWDKFFTDETANQLDFFCSRKYKASKSGITRFSINREGVITEAEMIVDVRFDYNTGEAKLVNPGILLIPFTYKRKRGLLRLDYQPDE